MKVMKSIRIIFEICKVRSTTLQTLNCYINVRYHYANESTFMMGQEARTHRALIPALYTDRAHTTRQLYARRCG